MIQSISTCWSRLHCLLAFCLLLATIAFGGSHSSVFADDWYRWRGPHLNGISSETDWNCDWPGGNPRIAWTCAVGTGYSSIVVQADRAYTIGHIDRENIIFCLDVSNGQTIWKYAFPADLDDRDFEGGPTSTPTIDGDRVYVLSRSGDLFCLGATTGTKHWQKQIVDDLQVRLPGWGFAAAPLVVGDKLLLNVGESGAALNKHDGSLIWSSADRECGYAAPVLIADAEPATAVFASGRAFIGVDVESGKQLWTERWLTSFNCNAADPIIDNGKMFLSSGYNRGAALFQLAEGKPKLIWKTKEMQNQLHSSLLYQDHVYGIDGDMETGARLKCIQWSTGNVVWSVDDLRPGGLTMAGSKLLLLSASGELAIAEATPAGWTPIARGQVLNGKCGTVPVLSSGRLFCRSVQGQLACVDLRD